MTAETVTPAFFSIPHSYELDPRVTGNDEVYVRELFKSGTNMKFKAKIVIVTNSYLDAPGMDSAFSKRVVVVPFESTFTDEKKNSNDKYYFPLDPDIENKIFRYRSVFMRMILEEYEVFKERGLEVPDYIKSKTSEYITFNNYPLKFIKKTLRRDLSRSMDVESMYDDFKEWINRSYPRTKIPFIEALLTELMYEDFNVVDGVVEGVTSQYNF